jgi:DNA replication protein DnaC
VRSADDVEKFKLDAAQRIIYGCSKCEGKSFGCACIEKYNIAVAAYEACVPQDFWFTADSDIKHNRKAFTGDIKKYCTHINKALRHGYGLILLGDNGVGKTMFVSYVLMCAISKGRTAYYTTLPQLDHNIKRGFNEHDHQRRLDWMLTSDFLAIDEMGKEKYKTGPTFINAQIERILKNRFDDSLPTLIATNMGLSEWIAEYGSTIGSIVGGKYRSVKMEPGDYRLRLGTAMEEKMGWK